MEHPPRVPVDELTRRPDLAASFPPTRAAALARVRSVDPTAYARTRNHLRGAVSRLSPYLTHGLVSVPDVPTSHLRPSTRTSRCSPPRSLSAFWKRVVPDGR